MSAGGLNILLIEPFYGGFRRQVLDVFRRHTRHRVRILKLPARRPERRLQVAANWFAQQIDLHGMAVGEGAARSAKPDVVLTTEMLDLGDLLKQVPALAKLPVVAWFLDHQLDIATPDSPLRLCNFNTAMAATEVWFASGFACEYIIESARRQIRQNPEMPRTDPDVSIRPKSRIMPPPVSLDGLGPHAGIRGLSRRAVLVDSFRADAELLNRMLLRMARRGEKFEVCHVGPAGVLDGEVPHRNIETRDEPGVAKAVAECGLYLSTRRSACFDPTGIAAMANGAWPIVPDDGFYAELLPEYVHSSCLHSRNPMQLHNMLLTAFHQSVDRGAEDAWAEALSVYDAAASVGRLDVNLERATSAFAFRK